LSFQPLLFCFVFFFLLLFLSLLLPDGLFLCFPPFALAHDRYFPTRSSASFLSSLETTLQTLVSSGLT